MSIFDELPPDPMKGLAINYLIAVAPFVARHLHIQDTAEILKVAVTHHMLEQQKLTVDEAAEQLQRSQRWTYKHRNLIKALLALKEQLPMHLELLNYFVQNQDPGGRVEDCSRHLEEHDYQTTAEEIGKLLAAYCRSGYLVSDGDLYQWKGQAQVIDTAQVVGRASRVAGLVGLISSLLKRHVDSDTVYLRHIHLTLTRNAHDEMVRELRTAVEKTVKRAVLRSLEEDPEQLYPDAVIVDGILLMGSTRRKRGRKE